MTWITAYDIKARERERERERERCLTGDCVRMSGILCRIFSLVNALMSRMERGFTFEKEVWIILHMGLRYWTLSTTSDRSSGETRSVLYTQ